MSVIRFAAIMALLERGEQRALPGVVQPVGVAGQRGGLGQRGEPGEQRGAGVGGQVVDVGDPAGPGEFQRQQRQQVVQRRDGRGAGVAGGGDHAGQVERDQVGQGEQQSPALAESHRCGQVAKSRAAVRGSWVSRPAVAAAVEACSAGWRSSRPNPSSDRISPTLVRLRGVPSAASRAEIS